MDIVHQILHHVEEFLQHNKPLAHVGNGRIAGTPFAWQAPPVGFVKVNIDGLVCYQNSQATVGDLV